MKFDMNAFGAPRRTGVTALVMLLSSGAVAWAGGGFANPYTPKPTDPVDHDRVQHPGPKTSPFAALKKASKAPARGVTVRLEEEAPVKSAESFLTARPRSQSASGTAAPQSIVDGGRVSPRLTLQARVGNERNVGTADLFLPFFQTSDSVAFFDIRGVATSEEVFEGNVGIGYRQSVGALFGQEAVAGGYAFFDVRETANDNTYFQGMAGIELLTPTVEARINGYLPNSDRNVLAQGGTFTGLVGTTVTTLNVASIVEQSLPGIEAELGYNLQLTDAVSANLTGGYFHFERDGIRAAGPKGRLTFSIDDPIGLDGAIFGFGAEFRHDDLRDTEISGFASLSIPLSQSPVARRDLSPLTRLLGARVQRDIDIVVPTVRDTANVAPNAAVVGAPLPDGSAPGAPSAAGEIINVFHIANEAQGAADCSDAANACTATVALTDPLAGPGDFFIPVDVAGEITADLGLFADLQSVIGQSGGGSVTLLLPDEAGNTLTLDDLGGRAAIQGTITPSNGSILANFDLDGGAGNAIEVLDDIGFGTARVQDVDITGGAGGFFAGRNAIGAITFDAESSITGVEGTSVGIEAQTFEATFNNSIGHDGAGSAVSIIGHQTGTIEFNGNITASSQAADPVFLSEAGGTIVFNGDLDLTSPGETAFNASNVTGALSIADAATVTLETDTGAALILDGVAVGRDGINIDTITANGPDGTDVPVAVRDVTGGAVSIGSIDIDGTDSVLATGDGVDGVVIEATGAVPNADVVIGTLTIDDVSGNGLVVRGPQGRVEVGQTAVTQAGGAGILIEDVSEGAVVFTDTVKLEATAPGASGVLMDGNAGGSVAFEGGLDIAVGEGIGLGAFGGGELTVLDTGVETITATGGVALALQDIVIGAEGLSLDSVTATDSPLTAVAIDNVSGGTVDIDTVTIDGVVEDQAAIGALDEIAGDALSDLVQDAMVITDSAATFTFGTIDVSNAEGAGLVLFGANGDIVIDELLLNGNGFDGFFPFEDALLIEGATNDVTVNGGNIGADVFNGFNLTIADQAATSTITIADFDVFTDAEFGPLLLRNAGTIAFKNVLFEQSGPGAALDIIGGTATITADEASEIINTFEDALDALFIGGVEGGEISIAGSITHQGDGDVVEVARLQGGTIRLSGDISGPDGGTVEIDGVADGALVEISGDVSLNGASEDAIRIDDIAEGGTVRFTDRGSVSITGASDDGIDLEDISGTVAFDGDVAIADNGDHGLSVNAIGATGLVEFGAVSITGTAGDAIDIEDTIDGRLAIDDLDIGLTEAGTTGVDLSGAVINGTVRATDLDVTSSTEDGTIGIDIAGTTGNGGVTFGDVDTADGGESASVSGTAIGVQVASDTNLDFTFGDGEDTADTGSVIDAVQAIGSADGPLPTEGSYDFLDVDFGAAPSLSSDVSNLRGVNLFYVDQDGADQNSVFAAGTVHNPGSVAEAIAAEGIDAIVLLDTAVDGAADRIVVSDAVQGAGTSLVLDDGQVLLSFADGDAAVDLAEFDVVADSLTPPFLFTGVDSSTVVETPDGIDVGPELTTEAGASVVEIAGSAGISNTTITAAGDIDGVIASGFSAPGTVLIEDSTISVEDGTAVSIAAGGQDVDVILEELDLTGDTPLEIEGGATLTIQAFRNISAEGGTSTITGAEFSAQPGGGAVEGGTFNGGGLDLSSVTGALAFDSVDIDSGRDLALSVEGVSEFGLSINGGTVTGAGIDFERVDMDVTLDEVTLGNDGLELDRVTGTLDIVDGTITSNNAQTAIDIGGNANGSGGDAEITIGADIENSSGRSVLIQELTGGFVSITGIITDTDDGILISEIDRGTPAEVTLAGDIDITNGGIEFRDIDDATVKILGTTTLRNASGGPGASGAIEFDESAGRVDILGDLLIDGTRRNVDGLRFIGDVGEINIEGQTSITGTSRHGLSFRTQDPIQGNINIDDLDIALDAGVNAIDIDGAEMNADLTIDDFDVTAILAELSSQSLQAAPLVFDGPVSRTAEVIAHDPVFQAPSGALSLTFVADAVDGTTALLSKDSNGFDDGGHITLFVEDGQLRLRAQTETQSLEVVGGTVTPGAEQVVELVWAGEQITLVLDGVEIGTVNGWTGPGANLEPIVLGASQARSGDGVANRLEGFFSGQILASEFTERETDIAGSVGVNLEGTTGTGTIRLGASEASDNGATIASGIETGVSLSDETNIDFIFGDGEEATGTASLLGSTVQINAPTPPTGGTYNFADVDFGETPRNVFPAPGQDIIFVADQATGDGSGSDVNNLAGIATIDLDAVSGASIILINEGAGTD